MTSLREEADTLAARAEAAFLRGDHGQARAAAKGASVIYAATAGLSVRTEPEAPPDDAWLDTVYAAASTAHARHPDALSLIYDTIDDLLLARRFGAVDHVLARVDVARLDITLALGLLSITLAARDRLANRPALVERVEVRVRELAPDRIDALMDGLRGDEGNAR